MNGQLQINPSSGVEPPEEWLQTHSEPLVRTILECTALDAYRYDSYSTGQYGPHKAPGVTIQFISVLQGQSAYAVFNAELKRIRGHNKGTSLPQGRFRISKRSHFYKFWLRAGLKLPDRLGRFHDYMGNLRGILFSGNALNERLDAGTLSPLCIRTEWINRHFLPPSIHPTSTHHPPNIHPTVPHNDSQQSLTDKGFQADQSTGVSKHGNTDARDTGTRDIPYSSSNPVEQTNEEWLADYGEAEK